MRYLAWPGEVPQQSVDSYVGQPSSTAVVDDDVVLKKRHNRKCSLKTITKERPYWMYVSVDDIVLVKVRQTTSCLDDLNPT